MTSIGFASYSDNFLSNMVDGEALLELTTAELKDDLGIAALGARKEILRQISTLKS